MQVREHEVLIPMPDGIELAADLRLPDDWGRWPVLLTYIPYRKDDFLAASFEFHNNRLCDAGYAVLVADIEARAPRPETWAMHSIRRRARRSCKSSSGLRHNRGRTEVWGCGVSPMGRLLRYGLLRSDRPHLRAVVAIQGALDMYNIVFPHGVANYQGAIGAWGSLMLALQLLPPSHRTDGERWKEVWDDRLADAEPLVMPWFSHPTCDDFWRCKKIAGDRIDIPVFLIGSWRDIFAQDMIDAFVSLKSDSRLWMGPWMHGSPDFALNEPIDHLPAMIDWCDRWLQDGPTLPDDDPRVRIFVQNVGWRDEPTLAGRWFRLTLPFAGDGTLVEASTGAGAWRSYDTDPRVGVCGGLWEPLALGCGLPGDQALDDDRSLCFTSKPFADGLTLIGNPVVHLRVRLLSGEDAVVVARLCEVCTDGMTRLITVGHRRLSHTPADSVHQDPDGHQEHVLEVPLIATAYALAPGSRVRVAMSCSFFPQLMPTPTNPSIAVRCGSCDGSTVHLPVAAGAAAAPGPPPPGAENRRPLLQSAEPRWSTTTDHVAESVSVSSGMRVAFKTTDRSGVVELDHVATVSVAKKEPESATLEGRTA